MSVVEVYGKDRKYYFVGVIVRCILIMIKCIYIYIYIYRTYNNIEESVHHFRIEVISQGKVIFKKKIFAMDENK